MVYPNRCFYIVALAALAMVMATTLPTSLYSLYSDTFHLTPILITLVYSAYPIVVIPVLFLLGPLGDKYGRKPVLLVATAVGIIALLCLEFAQGLAWLLIGRALQGLALGVGFGNSTAALVEFEPNGDRKRANTTAGTSLFAGLVLGPLVAGVLGKYLPYPLMLSYLVNLALLIAVFILLFTVPEEHEKQKNAPLIYKPTVPQGKSAAFFSASLAAGLVFAMSGLYYSLAPTYVETVLKINNIAVGGAVVALMAFVAATVQFFGAQVKAKLLMSLGEWFLIAGLGLLILAIDINSFTILLVGAVVSGVGYGAAFYGAVAVINAIAPMDQRGNVTSSFYAICYVLLALPTIGIGFVAQATSLTESFAGFSLAVIVIAVIHLAWVAVKAKNEEFA